MPAAQPDLFDGATTRTRCRRDPCDEPGKARHSGAVGRHGAKRAGAPPSPGAGPFHARGSDTSRAAAESVAQTLAYRQMAVLRVLRNCGPLTGEEIADRLGLETYRVLPRLTELAKNPPRVRKTAKRRTNRSGSSASVWAAIW